MNQSRLKPVTTADANEEQLEVWERIVASRGGADRLTGADGGLMGPFNAMVSSPTIGRRVAELGAAVRRESSLPENLLELAICTTGAHWKANFEWWAHRALAVTAGVDEDILDSIEVGGDPKFADAAEQAVHGFASRLVADGRVDDSTWATAKEHLTDQQLVDLVTTIGYYCLISATLNAFQIPLPEGQDPIWPE
ncbi:MAG: carboxymuconolactone decarboxylase family protein [Actinomycetia bacterium]|nr:carboxymuconolactone decarboxylase family protein [Actinomycetes bacterium]MCP4959769.1 carboxymuconolactone decarboxylase family protein [Actinomycetes bacterium]